MRNLPSLASLASLSEVVTGIEHPPGGASRIVLHGMAEDRRREALAWAQELQDKSASFMW